MGLTCDLLTLVVVISARGQGCPTGWFGAHCIFKCYCSLSVDCGNNGECPNDEPCKSGYFGPGCQYVDLAARHATPLNGSAHLHDSDDLTCSQNRHVTSVRLALDTALPTLWFRVVANDFRNLFNFVLFINELETCIDERRLMVSQFVVDIACSRPVLVKELRLEGKIVPDLCSVYVSGGRNVALKQFANQTGSYGWSGAASNAVDGNTNGTSQSGSCAQTNNSSPPKWSLHFTLPQRVLIAIIYSPDNTTPLGGFTLRTYSKEGRLTTSFTDASTAPQPVYRVPLNVSVPVVSLEVVGAGGNRAQGYALQLCEVVVYGDYWCPTDRYGLMCEKPCACSESQSCSSVTGACGLACPDGRYGVDCSSNCSDRCYQKKCDVLSGTCYICTDGFGEENCSLGCPDGYFGKSCHFKCPPKCLQTKCHKLYGTCYLCQDGYTGHYCQNVLEAGSILEKQDIVILLLLVIVALLLILILLILLRDRQGAQEPEAEGMTAASRRSGRGKRRHSAMQQELKAPQYTQGKAKRSKPNKELAMERSPSSAGERGTKTKSDIKVRPSASEKLITPEPKRRRSSLKLSQDTQPRDTQPKDIQSRDTKSRVVSQAELSSSKGKTQRSSISKDAQPKTSSLQVAKPSVSKSSQPKQPSPTKQKPPAPAGTGAASSAKANTKRLSLSRDIQKSPSSKPQPSTSTHKQGTYKTVDETRASFAKENAKRPSLSAGVKQSPSKKQLGPPSVSKGQLVSETKPQTTRSKTLQNTDLGKGRRTSMSKDVQPSPSKQPIPPKTKQNKDRKPSLKRQSTTL